MSEQQIFTKCAWRLIPFMERMISYMERTDTATIRVVFSPPSNSTLSKADEVYAAKYSSSGKIFEPITPHFDTQRSSAPL